MFKESGLDKRKREFNVTVSERFKDKIDFSLSDFINMSIPITLRCIKHNVIYKQAPRSLLGGLNGCKTCYAEQFSKNNDYFIEKAKKTHGKRYGYDLVNYVRSNQPVAIVCKIHGIFHQRPLNHIRGQHCPECALDSLRKHPKTEKTILDQTAEINRKLFINKAMEKYGDVYDYSNVVYTGADNKVEIICPVHGSFNITPHSFLREKSKGCYECSLLSDDRVNRIKEKIIMKHGDIYDFTKFNITDKRWTLICKKHNYEFTQLPQGVFRHRGCPKCLTESYVLGKDEFVRKAHEYWNHLYTYDKVDYVNGVTPVIITCPKHGDFSKLPLEHLRRKGGCSVCSAPVGEQAVYDVLTKLNITFVRQFKIKPYDYRYDFLIPEKKLLIEYDEAYHMEMQKNIDNDKLKNVLAELNNYTLIRISEAEYLSNKNVIYLKLNRHIKYLRDGKCFSNFLEFCRYYNLPGDATPEQYKHFLFKNQYTI